MMDEEVARTYYKLLGYEAWLDRVQELIHKQLRDEDSEDPYINTQYPGWQLLYDRGFTPREAQSVFNESRDTDTWDENSDFSFIYAARELRERRRAARDARSPRGGVGGAPHKDRSDGEPRADVRG
jgi:hypothetical protein